MMIQTQSKRQRKPDYANLSWRNIGDTTYQAFNDFLKGSPLSPFVMGMYYAGRPHTKLLLAQIDFESNLGTSALYQTTKNPLGLRPKQGDDDIVVGGAFKRFEDPIEAVTYWRCWICDIADIFANTIFLDEFVALYAPSVYGNNEEFYLDHLKGIIDSLPSVTQG